MKLSLRSTEGNLARVDCEGEIRFDGDSSIVNPIEKVLGVGCYAYKVLLNLEKTTYIESRGVAWLVRCHKDFENGGGIFVLHSIPPMVDHVLQLLNMPNLLNIAPDEEAAMTLARGSDS